MIIGLRPRPRYVSKTRPEGYTYDKEESYREHLSEEQRRHIGDTSWRLERELYLACAPSKDVMRRMARQLREDADWLQAVVDGLEPSEAALDAEYGPRS